MAFTQLTGEQVLYQQQVVNDTILSASWSVSSGNTAGMTIAAPVNTGTTSTVLVTMVNSGDYILACQLTLASAQVRKGQASITGTVFVP